MNTKEVAEIRRRFRPERSNIRRVCGCLVNEKREIVTSFEQPLGELYPTLTEKLLPVMRRALSGTLGRNLQEIAFSAAQVAGGEEHACLNRLRRSALEDKEALAALYDRIRHALSLDGSYLILLTQESYDVPSYNKSDGEQGSGEVYTYLLCAICPVKAPDRATLGFLAHENAFSCTTGDPCVASPEIGFLFPAFDGRAANLYSALYYTRSIKDNHPELAEAVFRAAPPPPAAVQRDRFRTLLSDAVGEDCSYAVVESARVQIGAMLEAHKAERDPEPLYVGAETMREVLSSAGVSAERGDAFVQAYNSAFGQGAEIAPANLLDPRRLEVHTPDVSIKVSPDRGGLLETRTIDGVRYILIRAEGDVQVNGVPVCFGGENLHFATHAPAETEKIDADKV